MIECFNITKTSMIPATAGVKALTKKDVPQHPKEAEEMREIPYREVVGSLIWAVITPRCDIVSTTMVVTKFSDTPGISPWKAVTTT